MCAYPICVHIPDTQTTHAFHVLVSMDARTLYALLNGKSSSDFFSDVFPNTTAALMGTPNDVCTRSPCVRLRIKMWQVFTMYILSSDFPK
jgi:hypothetical protein